METVADEKTSKTIILGSQGSGFRVPLICEDQLFLSIENRGRSGSYRLTGHRSATSSRYQADRDIGHNGLLP